MQVCVLGAGIVGLATAYELHQRGMQVTVIDQAQPGAGAGHQGDLACQIEIHQYASRAAVTRR